MTNEAKKKYSDCYHDWYKDGHNPDRILCHLCDSEPRTRDKDRAEAIVFLRDRIKAGQVIYTGLDHVSRSGMLRVISVYLIEDNQPWNISGYVAKAIDSPRDDRRGGVRVGGCGMDMGFHIVYGLSRVLFRQFYCDGSDKCPSNDHNNERGEQRKAGYKAGRLHSDGGYALTHRWL